MISQIKVESIFFSLVIVMVLLTHLPLDKMVANFADNIFKCIFLNETDRIAIYLQKCVPMV